MSSAPCGHATRPGQRYCTQCGAKLPDFTSAVGGPPAEATPHGAGGSWDSRESPVAAARAQPGQQPPVPRRPTFPTPMTQPSAVMVPHGVAPVVTAPLPTIQPTHEMGREEREMRALLARVEKEKERILEDQRLKEREETLAREEERYVREKQKEHIRKLNAGPLELGPARESVYVHRMKDHAIVSLDLLEETLTDKHRSHAYTVYKVKVMWTDCVWTIQRRYSQFREFNKAVTWKTGIKLPYPIPGKHLLHSLEDEVIAERKLGLRQYLKGVEEVQLEFLNNEKYEQILIRFLGPFQLGDTKDHVPHKLPFKVKL